LLIKHAYGVSSFFVCVACVLVPSPLIEFRYFIVPYVILSLYIRPPATQTATYMEILVFVVVNIITIAVFMYRPFTAPDGSVGRFMW